MAEEIRLLKEEVEKLRCMLLPIDLHTQTITKLIESIKKHRRFRSKRQWALYARVSMDTFYRSEKEVLEKLAAQGYKIVYEPDRSKKNSRVYCYRVRLEY